MKKPFVMAQKIKQELAAERFIGPFTAPPFEPTIISPVRMAPKSGAEEGLTEAQIASPWFQMNKKNHRLIHNLSHPHGCESVNSHIPESASRVHYQSFDDAVELCRASGPDCFMAKADLHNAFRQLPVRRDNIPLLGFKFNNQFFYNTVLPFGCSSSCQIFEKFSSALHWAVSLLNSLDNPLSRRFPFRPCL